MIFVFARFSKNISAISKPSASGICMSRIRMSGGESETIFLRERESEVERIWAKGNTIIFDIDVQGGVNLKRIFGEQAFSVFIQAPSVDILRERLIGRGTDTPEAIEKRVAKAASEMEFAAGKFDYTLVNDDLSTALAEAERIIGDFLDK